MTRDADTAVGALILVALGSACADEPEVVVRDASGIFHHVICVAIAAPLMLAASGLSPGHRDLRSVL